MTIHVVVDSTADIPPTRARELGIEVIPLTVLFGDEAFRDGVDLDGPAFYRRLSTSPVMPTTSTPPPALFEQTYRAIARDGATGILALHIGSLLSGTYSVSKAAATSVSTETGVPIEVVDSGQVSGGYGLPAVIVAQEARQGASLAQVSEHAHSLLDRVRVYAVLDTLEFLRRGGRIGRAQAMLGTMLSVKPLVEVRDGQVLPLEKVRTQARAIERIGQLVTQLGPLEAAALVASDEQIAAKLTAIIHGFWKGPLETFALGAIIGTHAGPGAGGIVAIPRAQ